MNPALKETWKQEPPSQFLLWVDGVGGFLICLENRVTLGQAGGEKSDIGILADISRHHATIQRDPEGYFLEAVRKVTINGQPVEKGFLHSGDRLTLGPSCQFLFTQPVPISASARLEPVSGHRFVQPVGAVIMMADSLVIGPEPAHVVMEDLPKPIILFRNPGGLGIRHDRPMTINGHAFKDRGPLEPGAKVKTEGLALALEIPQARR
ncbi:MAG: FHA domain-containing protein [Planctomycetes bacterium]|nr:FHA domain-containing protein [Planctomycetota bacterium]